MDISHLFLLRPSISLPHTPYWLGRLVSAKLRPKKKKKTKKQKNPLAHYHQNVSKMITSSTLLETLPAYLVLTGFLMCPVNWWVCWPRLASARITGHFPCGHLSCSTLAWACSYHGHRAPRESRSLKPDSVLTHCHFLIQSHNSTQTQGREKWLYCWWGELQLPAAAAAAAKSLQSCPTLCDPVDGSPPGSAVPGILQARTLEWAATW